MIIMIAAIGENNELGKNNGLVWHLPDDFKRFKELTTGHHIIMGRKTFESFPKPLPNRTHIVITRQKGYHPEGCIVVNTLKKALEKASNEEDVYIIGGGQIYEQGIAISDKMELTRVHATFKADTFFPEIKNEEWDLIKEEYHPIDDKHLFDFTYQTFIRK